MNADALALALTGAGIIAAVLFGVWRMTDALRRDLTAQIGTVNTRVDKLRDHVDVKVDTLRDHVDAKVDTLRDDLDAKIDKLDGRLYSLLLAERGARPMAQQPQQTEPITAETIRRGAPGAAPGREEQPAAGRAEPPNR